MTKQCTWILAAIGLLLFVPVSANAHGPFLRWLCHCHQGSGASTLGARSYAPAATPEQEEGARDFDFSQAQKRSTNISITKEEFDSLRTHIESAQKTLDTIQGRIGGGQQPSGVGDGVNRDDPESVSAVLLATLRNLDEAQKAMGKKIDGLATKEEIRNLKLEIEDIRRRLPPKDTHAGGGSPTGASEATDRSDVDGAPMPPTEE